MQGSGFRVDLLGVVVLVELGEPLLEERLLRQPLHQREEPSHAGALRGRGPERLLEQLQHLRVVLRVEC